jgi:tRNA nucleotidyltransferase (CCA-adding enzyme)
MNIWHEFNKRLPFEMRNDLQLFAKIANENSFKIYLVGGAVRDIIIGREISDADIMVDGDATDFAEIIKKNTGGKLLIHDAFFTAVLYLPSGKKYDFTSCRKEHYPFPGALPLTSPGTIHDDLFRRDFTINALAMELSSENKGEVIDFFDGINDIRNNIVRVLHNNSFISDPTRIFRAVRFESKLGFKMDYKTSKLAEDAISKKLIDRVSGERLFNEIKQICNNKLSEQIINRFKSLNLFTSISDEWRIPEAINFLDLEYLINTNQIFSPQICRLTWLMLLVKTKKDIEIISKRLRISKNIQKHLISSTDINECMDKLSEDNSCGGIDKIFQKLQHDTIKLISLITTSEIRAKINDYLLKVPAFELLINGDDLIREGIQSDKNMKQLLNIVRYYQYNGFVTSHSQALDLIRKLIN